MSSATVVSRRATAPSVALRHVLTHPSKIASAMDWKKPNGATVLSLTIQKESIGLAIASHPSLGEDVTVLEPLQLKPKAIRNKNKSQRLQQQKNSKKRPLKRDHHYHHYRQLSEVFDKYNVCGMVVSWPLQQETGKQGAACGRVLHALEGLLLVQGQERDDAEKTGTTNKTSILSHARPLCLWDSRHMRGETVDGWGRGVQFSTKGLLQQNSDKEQRWSKQASSVDTMTHHEKVGNEDNGDDQEYYYHYQYDDENATAANVWNDFCRVHWPELYYDQQMATMTTTMHHRQQLQLQQLQQQQKDGQLHHNNYNHHAWVINNEQWNDSSAHVNEALL